MDEQIFGQILTKMLKLQELSDIEIQQFYDLAFGTDEFNKEFAMFKFFQICMAKSKEEYDKRRIYADALIKRINTIQKRGWTKEETFCLYSMILFSWTISQSEGNELTFPEVTRIIAMMRETNNDSLFLFGYQTLYSALGYALKGFSIYADKVPEITDALEEFKNRKDELVAKLEPGNFTL